MSNRRHCPFLLESDTISLSKDFALSGTSLQDIPLGVTHRMRPSAVALLFALHEGASYRTLLRLSRVQKISDAQLDDLMGFLNAIGALERKRVPAEVFRARIIQSHHILLGVRYATLAWRRPATPLMTFLGVMRAILLVIVAVVMVATAAILAHLAPSSQVVGISAFSTFVFAGTLFIHEMIHVRIASRRYVRPRILQMGLRLGVIHRKLTPDQEALSSLSGPLAGSTISIAVASVALAFNAPLYAVAGALIALLHCLSLMPWYGDGASFHKALRERKSICNK